jgi:ABC-2 type transport system permease protein
MQVIVQNYAKDHVAQTGGRDVHAPVEVVTRNWFNPNLNPREALVPCLICVLATVVGLLLSALSIAREREMGTFEQLLVTPFSPLEILIGKAVPAVVMATFSAGLITSVVIFAFGIMLKGSFLLLLISLEAFLLAIIGIGLFISSLSMTQQQAVLGCFLVMPPMIMLSGFATPVENMPGWLQTLTVVNPIRWFIVIIKGLFLRGMSTQVVLANMLPLLAIATCTLSAAVFMFKRRME